MRGKRKRGKFGGREETTSKLKQQMEERAHATQLLDPTILTSAVKPTH